VKDGFIRVAAANTEIRVADPIFNAEKIMETIALAKEKDVKILVFPELSLSAYTCGDLFLQDELLISCEKALMKITEACLYSDMLIFVGLPVLLHGNLYNAAAVLQNGKLLALIPKTNIPHHAEYAEGRYFKEGEKKADFVSFMGEEVPFGTDIHFVCKNMPKLRIAAEIGFDLWAADSPSVSHAAKGANLIVCPSATAELTSRAEYRRMLAASHSAKNICAYVMAEAGEGESTTDFVYGGQHIIAENGTILKEAERFVNGMIISDVDLGRISADRKRMAKTQYSRDILEVEFSLNETEFALEREIEPMPFAPKNGGMDRLKEIFMIQMMGLKKRLSHTICKNIVIGISGGLDSTLALLVAVKAFDALGIDRKNIDAVTMPCFGTTDRTYTNACEMARRLGVSLTEIDIKEAVKLHFKEIGLEEGRRDVAYENSQARERTQVLMDFANKKGGMVLGTGDMSELALGWATYNGDHMSMYGVNANIPKTLVRHLVRYYAETCGDESLKEILFDVLDTPVSPELLPPEEGKIAQKTEDIVGPYELHDFFMYYILRFGFSPKKIFRMACHAFDGVYAPEIILKWQKTFTRRFFTQQFKRSCLPDGPKVGSAGLSPRGDLRMPSDASYRIWMDELENITL